MTNTIFFNPVSFVKKSDYDTSLITIKEDKALITQMISILEAEAELNSINKEIEMTSPERNLGYFIFQALSSIFISGELGKTKIADLGPNDTDRRSAIVTEIIKRLGNGKTDKKYGSAKKDLKERLKNPDFANNLRKELFASLSNDELWRALIEKEIDAPKEAALRALYGGTKYDALVKRVESSIKKLPEACFLSRKVSLPKLVLTLLDKINGPKDSPEIGCKKTFGDKMLSGLKTKGVKDAVEKSMHYNCSNNICAYTYKDPEFTIAALKMVRDQLEVKLAIPGYKLLDELANLATIYTSTKKTEKKSENIDDNLSMELGALFHPTITIAGSNDNIKTALDGIDPNRFHPNFALRGAYIFDIDDSVTITPFVGLSGKDNAIGVYKITLYGGTKFESSYVGGSINLGLTNFSNTSSLDGGGNLWAGADLLSFITGIQAQYGKDLAGVSLYAGGLSNLANKYTSLAAGLAYDYTFRGADQEFKAFEKSDDLGFFADFAARLSILTLGINAKYTSWLSSEEQRALSAFTSRSNGFSLSGRLNIAITENVELLTYAVYDNAPWYLPGIGPADFRAGLGIEFRLDKNGSEIHRVSAGVDLSAGYTKWNNVIDGNSSYDNDFNVGAIFKYDRRRTKSLINEWKSKRAELSLSANNPMEELFKIGTKQFETKTTSATLIDYGKTDQLHAKIFNAIGALFFQRSNNAAFEGINRDELIKELHRETTAKEVYSVMRKILGMQETINNENLDMAKADELTCLVGDILDSNEKCQ